MAVYGFTVNADGNSIQVMKKIEEALASMGVKANIETKKVANEFTQMGQRIGGTFNSLKGLLLGGLGIAAGFEGLKAFFNLGTEMEQTNVAFEVMLGSAEKAKDMVGQLQQFANVTPFTSKDINEAGKMLLNFGISADNIIPDLKMLGDAAGGNAERFKGMTYAFAQVQSTGRLMGQDLLQLINAGFNPLQEISRTTGKSMGDLKKEMEKGNISAKMVADAFRSATGEGGRFYNMMKKQSETIGGKWSTLMDTIQTKMIALFDALTPLFGAVIDGFNYSIKGLITLFTSTSTAARVLRIVIMSVVAAWTIYTVITKVAVAWTALQAWWTGASTVAIVLNTLVTEGLTAAWIALTIVFESNPIGWIITLIVGLIIAIMTLWDKCKIFREIIGGVFGFFKQQIMTVVHAFTNFAQVVDDLIHGRFKKAFESGKKLFKDFKDDVTSGMIDSIKKGAEAAGNSEFKFGDLLKFGTGQQGPGKEFGQGGKEPGGITKNAINTSQLTGAKGGLGEAKVINIKIDTMQKVITTDNRQLKQRGQDAVEVMLRTLNNIAYSQSSVQ